MPINRLELTMADPNDMTSIEAAALILSNGETTDPEQAQLIADGKVFDLDKMKRAHLRRMMGFDFDLKFTHRKFYVRSKQPPFVTAQASYEGDPWEPEAIDKLVGACLTLKNRYEAAKKKQDT